MMILPELGVGGGGAVTRSNRGSGSTGSLEVMLPVALTSRAYVSASPEDSRASPRPSTGYPLFTKRLCPSIGLLTDRLGVLLDESEAV